MDLRVYFRFFKAGLLGEHRRPVIMEFGKRNNCRPGNPLGEQQPNEKAYSAWFIVMAAASIVLAFPYGAFVYGILLGATSTKSPFGPVWADSGFDVNPFPVCLMIFFCWVIALTLYGLTWLTPDSLCIEALEGVTATFSPSPFAHQMALRIDTYKEVYSCQHILANFNFHFATLVLPVVFYFIYYFVQQERSRPQTIEHIPSSGRDQLIAIVICVGFVVLILQSLLSDFTFAIHNPWDHTGLRFGTLARFPTDLGSVDFYELQMQGVLAFTLISGLALHCTALLVATLLGVLRLAVAALNGSRE